MNNPITEETIRQATPTSIGGRFFKTSTKENGIDTLVLNSVIYMKGLFGPDCEDFRSFNNLAKYYNILNSHGQDFFFCFSEASASGDYGIFSFHTSTDWKSLSELTLPLDDDQALTIFKTLVNLIYNYSKSELNKEKYHPLLFICKESVYFRYVKNTLQIKLLPLLFEPDTQHPGLPREALDTRGDITSDLFMAAFLYLSLKYPNGEGFTSKEQSKYISIAERCLSPFMQRRYSAEQLLELLDNTGTTTPIKENDLSENALIVSTSKKNLTKKNEENEREKQKKPKLLFLKRLLMKIIPMDNTVFDAAKKAVENTTNGEKVADLLSTEDGDNQEDNQ